MSRSDPIREAAAAKALRESIAGLGEDEALLLDTIEGETGLFECIDVLLASIAEDGAMVEGVDLAVRRLKGRSERYERRIASHRALIEQAMMIADLIKIERPAGTLSLVPRAATAEITTESEIPSQFWKPGAPQLDRKALVAALKEGPVTGAVLSNKAPSLTIRTV